MTKMSMTVIIAAFLAATPSFAAPAEDDAYSWHDGTTLNIEGRGFPGMTASPYIRLPDKWKGVVPDDVWSASQTSIDMNVRFVTDSTEVVVRWNVGNVPPVHPQMTPGGMYGVDVYRRTAGCEWTHCREGTPDVKTGCGELRVKWDPGDECLVYLPMRIYRLKAFSVGVVKGSRFDAPPPHSIQKPVVHYGTSIVHGSRASRPGMTFTSIMARLADVEIVNLGFPGKGRMEPAMADVLAEIDASLYIVDCDWNMSVKMQQERYEPFVRKLKELRPDTPILLCGGCVETGVPRPQEVFAKGVFDKLKTENPTCWANLHFLSGAGMLPKTSDCTTDHIHPNDYGLAHMGPVYADAVRHVLGTSAGK